MMELTRYEFETIATPSTVENITQCIGEDYRDIPECQLILHEISHEHTSTYKTPIQVITKCLANMEK